MTVDEDSGVKKRMKEKYEQIMTTIRWRSSNCFPSARYEMFKQNEVSRQTLTCTLSAGWSGVIVLSSCSSWISFCFNIWMSCWYLSICCRAFSRSLIWWLTSWWNWSKLSITARYSSFKSFSQDSSLRKWT